MKFISANLLVASVLCGVVSPSCVYRSNPVPDMPYRPRRHTPPAQAPIPDPVVKPAQTAAAPAAPTMLPAPSVPATTDAWMTSRPAQPLLPAPAPKPPVAQTPKPAPAPAPVPAPAPKATPPAASGTHITQAPLPAPAAPPAPKPIAAAAQAPAAAPAQPAPAAADPKLISNNGAIPVATRVPGDPLRVYNPLDPSKKIKVIDKNGNPQPSGKKLKVPGTNFFFYVP